MPNQSYLDNKYFVDSHVYNCPFCNRRNVNYTLMSEAVFNWSDNKACHAYFVKCSSCSRMSMHLSYEDLRVFGGQRRPGGHFKEDVDLDSVIFYSVPTSFFVLDNRIPELLRDLITEAEGCLKMNYLTGASACARKAIYELTVFEKAQGANYEDRIHFLKTRYSSIEPTYFDILGHIQNMTSDKVHEQSWQKWDAKHLRVILEALKAVLYEIYVLPSDRKEQADRIRRLREEVYKAKQGKQQPSDAPTS